MRALQTKLRVKSFGNFPIACTNPVNFPSETPYLSHSNGAHIHNFHSSLLYFNRLVDCLREPTWLETEATQLGGYFGDELSNEQKLRVQYDLKPYFGNLNVLKKYLTVIGCPSYRFGFPKCAGMESKTYKLQVWQQ